MYESDIVFLNESLTYCKGKILRKFDQKENFLSEDNLPIEKPEIYQIVNKLQLAKIVKYQELLDIAIKYNGKIECKSISRYKNKLLICELPNIIFIKRISLFFNYKLCKFKRAILIFLHILYSPFLFLIEWLRFLYKYSVLVEKRNKLQKKIYGLTEQEQEAIKKMIKINKKEIKECEDNIISFSNILISILIPLLVVLIPIIIEHSLNKNIDDNNDLISGLKIISQRIENIYQYIIK